MAGDYRLMVLDAPAEILECELEQFFHILCPPTEASRTPYLRPPMSIYGYDKARGELRFLYRVAGEGTLGLATLAAGDKVNVLGPLGHGSTIRDEWRNLLLVARGVGLATLVPLVREARRLDRGLTAICSARAPEYLMSVDHFSKLGARIVTVTDAEGTSGMENLQRIIKDEIAERGVDAMYTCGSNWRPTLLQNVQADTGTPGQIALEQQMACGLGTCQCCVRSFRRDGRIIHERVCREGPVFDIAEAMTW